MPHNGSERSFDQRRGSEVRPSTVGLERPTWRVRAKFEKRDAWIGVYWDSRETGFYYGVNIRKSAVYICVVPFFPLIVSWDRVVGVDTGEAV